MPDSETEDEILSRIETALQKIAAAGKPVPSAAHATARGDDDRAQIANALDTIIGRLRDALEPAGQISVAGQHTE